MSWGDEAARKDAHEEEGLEEGLDSGLEEGLIPQLQELWLRSRKIAETCYVAGDKSTEKQEAYAVILELVRLEAYFGRPRRPRRTLPDTNPHPIGETTFRGVCAGCQREMIPPEPAMQYYLPDAVAAALHKKKDLFHPGCWVAFYAKNRHRVEELNLWGGEGDVPGDVPASADTEEAAAPESIQHGPPPRYRIPKKGRPIRYAATVALLRAVEPDYSPENGHCGPAIAAMLKDPRVREWAHAHGAGRGTLINAYYDERRLWRTDHTLDNITRTKKPQTAAEPPGVAETAVVEADAAEEAAEAAEAPASPVAVITKLTRWFFGEEAP